MDLFYKTKKYNIYLVLRTPILQNKSRENDKMPFDVV